MTKLTVCPACAEEIPHDSVVCPYCETRLSSRLSIQTLNDTGHPIRGRSLAPAAGIVPPPGSTAAERSEAAADPGAVPGWVVAGLVLVAIVLWPVGLAVGAGLALSRHPQQKKVGKLTLTVSLVIALLGFIGACSAFLLEAPLYY